MGNGPAPCGLRRISAAALLLLSAAPLLHAQTDDLRWRRSILPPSSAPFAEACVELDASTFSHAEPGLRDLRLYQDGVEIPYAVEESFDRHVLDDSAAAAADDRSLYVTAAGPAPLQAGRAQLDVPAHVPLERLRLLLPERQEVLSPAAATTDVTVRDADVSAPSLVETLRGTMTATRGTMPVMLGGNLQNAATVQVALSHAPAAAAAVVLEMRRRALCYQPRSASMLTLYLGGAEKAAPQYEFARHFSTDAAVASAQLGPIEPNPEFRESDTGGLLRSRGAQLRFALLVAIAALLFTVNRLLNAQHGHRH